MQHTIDTNDCQNVLATLNGRHLTQGPLVKKFEQEFARKLCVGNAVAVNSGTSALHIACLAIGLGPGDILWTTPNSFVASANAAIMCGAKVDFVDIDPDNYNLCLIKLENKLQSAELCGTLPKILMPVHFSGSSCEMGKIKELSDKYGFKIIEDACHALGATYQGQPVGNCSFSDISVFSLHPSKSITTGEGGVAVSNSLYLVEKMRMLACHGLSQSSTSHNPREPWLKTQISLGFNYRMTDILASLGSSQLTKLDRFINARRSIAATYFSELADINVKLPQDNVNSSWHLFPIQFQSSEERLDAYKRIIAISLPANIHYHPIHLQPFFRNFGFSDGDFKEAETYYQKALSIPIFPGLTDAQQREVVQIIKLVTGFERTSCSPSSLAS
jgi:UDP-4-amino-4,6-dideoxy-N-acetyl-beta-L-altrosamine transaminase